MTAAILDPLAHPTARALLAALDGGDDTALAPLADWLEEQGDPRAAGLRLIGDRRPTISVLGATWQRMEDRETSETYHLPDDTFDRLEGGERGGAKGGLPGWRYTTRSWPSAAVALMALAAALIETP